MSVHSIPAESPFGLFDTSEAGLSSVDVDQPYLDFQKDNDAQSQPDIFTSGPADIGISATTPNSFDLSTPGNSLLMDKSDLLLSFSPDGLGDQDASGGSCGLRARQLDFGDILSDEEHDCGNRVAACCVGNTPELTFGPGGTRVRAGCLWWSKMAISIASEL